MSQPKKNSMTTKLSREIIESLKLSKVGFEKESMRVYQSSIAQTDHPSSLGSSLCNSYITTDFSESQLEMITPPFSEKQEAISFLKNIHHFISHNIGDEVIWPFSMPPTIRSESEIRIANFGSSNKGKFRHIYRKGLSLRYGRLMQAISGVHFNFSFDNEIWLNDCFRKNFSNIVEARSENYFAMLRNIQRMNWLLIYSFGASPIISKNFIKRKENNKLDLERLDEDHYFLPYSTSLRMSDFGYKNDKRLNFDVSFDSLNEYISGLIYANENVCHEFSNFEKTDPESQLNSNFLQIEDEYYAVARPKSQNTSFTKTTSKLKKSGVDFIELRSLDLNPFDPLGIDNDTALFLEIFLILCLLMDSKPTGKTEVRENNYNDNMVAKYGRKPGLELYRDSNKVLMKDWSNEILDEMEMIANILDEKNNIYTNALQNVRARISNPRLTFSHKILDIVREENISIVDLGCQIAKKNKDYFTNISNDKNPLWNEFSNEAKRSHSQQQKLEKSDKSFQEFSKIYYKS